MPIGLIAYKIISAQQNAENISAAENLVIEHSGEYPAFSFANKEQFIAFTRNLGNQAAGVAFDLALKALDPMIQDVNRCIRDMVNRI